MNQFSRLKEQSPAQMNRPQWWALSIFRYITFTESFHAALQTHCIAVCRKRRAFRQKPRAQIALSLCQCKGKMSLSMPSTVVKYFSDSLHLWRFCMKDCNPEFGLKVQTLLLFGRRTSSQDLPPGADAAKREGNQAFFDSDDNAAVWHYTKVSTLSLHESQLITWPLCQQSVHVK